MLNVALWKNLTVVILLKYSYDTSKYDMIVSKKQDLTAVRNLGESDIGFRCTAVNNAGFLVPACQT